MLCEGLSQGDPGRLSRGISTFVALVYSVNAWHTGHLERNRGGELPHWEGLRRDFLKEKRGHAAVCAPDSFCRMKCN